MSVNPSLPAKTALEFITYAQANSGKITFASQVFRDARGGYFVSDDSTGWQDAYAKQLTLAWRPPPTTLRAAE